MTAQFGAFRRTKHTTERGPRDDFEPAFEVTPQIEANVEAINQAERDLLRYRPDDLEYSRLLREALAKNTFATVSIEGNPLSLSHVRSLLEEAPAAAFAKDPDERDVLNIAGFLGALASERAPVTVEDVEVLHGRLMDGTVAGAGRLKDAPNIIGNARTRTIAFIPADPERVPLELENLLRWYDLTSLPAPIACGLFFQEFQSIHPFMDGNGRLGRAITAAQMYDAGYVGVRLATIDYAINLDRISYYNALAEADRRDGTLTPWLTYFTGIVRTGYEDAAQRFLFHRRIADDLADDDLSVIMWLARRARRAPHRRFKIGDVSGAFPQIPRRSLQRSMARLVEAGLLRLEGAGRQAAYEVLPAGHPRPEEASNRDR